MSLRPRGSTTELSCDISVLLMVRAPGRVGPASSLTPSAYTDEQRRRSWMNVDPHVGLASLCSVPSKGTDATLLPSEPNPGAEKVMPIARHSATASCDAPMLCPLVFRLTNRALLLNYMQHRFPAQVNRTPSRLTHSRAARMLGAPHFSTVTHPLKGRSPQSSL